MKRCHTPRCSSQRMSAAAAPQNRLRNRTGRSCAAMKAKCWWSLAATSEMTATAGAMEPSTADRIARKTGFGGNSWMVPDPELDRERWSETTPTLRRRINHASGRRHPISVRRRYCLSPHSVSLLAVPVSTSCANHSAMYRIFLTVVFLTGNFLLFAVSYEQGMQKHTLVLMTTS